ncbi:MAG: amidohydrolase [Syntrophothermus sp.]|uniref:amidohydrolase n=1 Tax=Syntrophothermus sp. TaxID=2736299 RepID=UPI0025806FC0|nr:amidohydrolase [Syntrophothermus sp.]NSW82490.1 amidohydrolase [Syntrophothermus sp.]
MHGNREMVGEMTGKHPVNKNRRVLVTNVKILPMTGPHDFIPEGFLVIEGQHIREVGSGKPSLVRENGQIIDGKGKLVMPGFVNAHTHAAMTLMRGYADDLPLMEWLQNKIEPFECNLTGQDVYWGTMLGIAEMIKSGTTTFADMYIFMDDVARAVEETGIRAVLCRGMNGVGPNAEKALRESRDLASKWQGKADGRLKIMLGPHAPYTCPPPYLRRVMDLASELGLDIHTHLSETMAEVETIKKEYGKTPVAMFAEAGLFDHRVVAAHCVHLTDEDIETLAKNKVGVVHNPQSNMKLGSGIARVTELMAAGVTVALGTDGAASNNNLDMFEEARTAALLQKARKMDPRVITAYQALEMATVNGARVLGLDQEIGCIKPGMKADIILIDIDQPHFHPPHNLVAHLAYSAQASDVDTVIIDGKVVMQNRQLLTLNERTVLEEAGRVALRLVEGGL